ncbi:hypothetical protein OSB04_un000431 [Centaurea solstitialis]|uniref:Integrase catalytic domain-containing protein n=1 Tax=Centaurea solstitialis TaxID=347529 RepID=A0AA38SHF8_9ASTR|nr:hypothetical protein OSB04_un000431 [Centaurea solstitialis]
MGHRYYLVFLDDFTNFVWTFPLAKKSQVFSVFRSFHAFVRTQFNCCVKTVQCDNGGEFDNGPFREFCNSNGIVFRFSCPHTSPQNGKSERKIRSINNIVRTLLAHASIPPSFWPHALQHATYLLNILPNKQLQYCSPLKRLYQKTPTYSDLKVFGCLCYPLFPSSTLNKLQARSTPCVFLGHPSSQWGYKCFDLSARKIIISRHVMFDESTFPFARIHDTQPSSYSFLDDAMSPYVLQHMAPTNSASPQPHYSSTSPLGSPSPLSPTTHTPTTHLHGDTSSPPPMAHPPVDTSSSTVPLPPVEPLLPNPVSTRPVTRSQHGIFKPKVPFSLHTTGTRSPIPTNPVFALRDVNWKMAMDDEFDALIKNKTWELVPRPPNVNVIKSMWIFSHKERSNGSFKRHKARLVGDGKTQQVGIDCGETFSPVVKPATIRTVLSLALSKSWSIHQLDVKNAFLHGELKETVYMHQPMGFRDPTRPDHVCLLKKSLYGLKQAPGLDSLRGFIISRLKSEFAMKDLGPLSYFLGIAVTRHSGGLFLSQRKYAAEIIDRAGMSTCKPSLIPVDRKPKLGANASKSYADPTQYRRLAGALQHLTFTRPDITYAVQQKCLFMLIQGRHTYADWGGCPDTRRSTSGYCIYLGDNLISWSAKRQPTLSCSSAEAEYRGVANVVSESCWLRNLLLELHCPIRKATVVYCDNVSAIYLSGNPVQHQRTKHIEMDIHFVREKVTRGQVRVLHMPSRHQIADIFTKGLPLVLFEDFRDSLNIRQLPVSTAGVC